MVFRLILASLIILVFFSCSKKDSVYTPVEKNNPYKLYEEGIKAFENDPAWHARKIKAEDIVIGKKKLGIK